MTRSPFFLTAACAAILVSAPAFADEMSIQELMALDIEGLSQVQVSSASKRLEHVSEAPSVVSIVSEDDIKRYGAVNLHDVLNRVPSLQVLNSTANPNNMVTLRAASNQHYPNRILFLIDGRPVRDSYGGHLNYGLFTHYPVSNIQQIEVIRGPGSVLYGTNAYAGIVNIISKDACEGGCGAVQTTYGSFNRRDQEGSVSYAGEDWAISTAFKATDVKGQRFTIKDETSTEGSYRGREEGHGVFVKGHYKNLNMLAFVDRAAQSSLGIFGRFPESESDGKRATVDVGYEHNFDAVDTKVETHLTYNRTRSGYYTDAPERNSDDLLIAEVSLQTHVNDNLNLTYGGFFEHHDGYVADRAYQQHLHNLYAQIDYTFGSAFKFVGGVQLNDSELFKADISPRLAFIYTPYENMGMKLLYGEAFRSSTAVEREVSIPNVITGNVNMQPEVVETIEAQAFYNDDNAYVALTGYRSRMDDIISRTSNPFGAGVWITNTGEQVFHGVELEGKYYFADGWQVIGSASWQEGESDTDVDDPTFSPNFMAKMGVSYKTDSWSFGVFDSWFGTPQDIRETNPSVLQVNDAPQSYHLISTNLDVNLNAFIPALDGYPDINFTLYGENLLDEDVSFPEYNRKNINSFPIENGRAIYGRLRMTF
ncbi:MAG: TonB-dependent receptor [Alphaproteobacteria bacterium]|nr:TonB-dependent receptor [Alphaproteobacteria bacterium]